VNDHLAADERLSALEAAAGVVLGSDSAVALPRSNCSPLEALERRILPALERPPCLVSFSGGRDSSAVLAVAARLARRNGLPAPVPATLRFRGAERSAEDEWQEQVVAHVEVADWVRIEAEHELDCLGPVATQALRRHGLLWPPNAHFHVPLLQEASGGSLLTGVGGDEVFGSARLSRAAGVLAGTARPEPRDLLRVAHALSPAPLRRTVLRSRTRIPFPWLRPDAARDVQEALVRDGAAEPLRLERRLAWRLRLRYVRVGKASLAVLAADDDVRVVHPLADPGFCAALARLGRTFRHGTRQERMETVFGSLLPAAVARRPAKASFGQAAYGPHSRAFTESWDGDGIDPDLVDPDALRRAWPEAEHDGRLLTVLQAVWLAVEETRSGSGYEVGQAVHRPAE
jgi:Asparagine synthase